MLYVDGSPAAERDEVDEEHVLVTVPAEGDNEAMPAIVLGVYDGMDEDANDGSVDQDGDPHVRFEPGEAVARR